MNSNSVDGISYYLLIVGLTQIVFGVIYMLLGEPIQPDNLFIGGFALVVLVLAYESTKVMRHG